MARNGRYRVPLKRRRLNITNYYKRRKYILSGKPRLVVRKTNRYIIAQIITTDPIGDKTIAAVNSKELQKYGWKVGFKNTPAAYLTGLLLGKKVLKKGIKEAIVDIGLHTPTPQSKVFAVVKGALDAGLKIPVSEKVLPTEDRIEGRHIAEYAKMLKEENPEIYNLRFKVFISRQVDPERIYELFNNVREEIVKTDI